MRQVCESGSVCGGKATARSIVFTVRQQLNVMCECPTVNGKHPPLRGPQRNWYNQTRTGMATFWFHNGECSGTKSTFTAQRSSHHKHSVHQRSGHHNVTRREMVRKSNIMGIRQSVQAVAVGYHNAINRPRCHGHHVSVLLAPPTLRLPVIRRYGHAYQRHGMNSRRRR